MHIITPYNPWAPKKKKTWQEELWEQQQIAEIEAKMLAEASSKTLPDNAPPTSLATVGPSMNAMAGGGGIPVPAYFNAGGDEIVDFVGSPLTGDGPLTVVFTNLTTTPQFDTYVWDFGDGTTSSDINPTHVYQSGSDAGYDVKLSVSHSSGDITSSLKAGYISASIPTVAAAYTFTTTSKVAPFTASFVNTSTNSSQTPTTTYRWVVFNGNNTYSSSATNFALRIDSGSYTASLQATGSYNIKNVTSSMFLSPAPTLTAAFTMTTSSKYNPSTATFLNTLNGAGGTQYNGNGSLTYRWELGSGSLTASSVIPNPTSYTVTGKYTASLAVTESSYGLMSYFTRSFFIDQTSLSGLLIVTTSSNSVPATASYTASYVYTGSGTVEGYFDMGEGTQVLLGSTQANPVMIGSDTVGAFTVAGPYTASLHLTESAAGLTFGPLTQSFYLAP